ncbi:hypothetical protein CMUS01_03913 [Colletotrichum musicola]|uniref:Ankyrin repeat protein n=1 Tax=Colletotrichum musicola TaxID=2175873 RepID=A0A8H6U497_9PEZI|nr:hypothetical protein CMUS01_03913 [Colletotrichum musicola]
MHFIGLRGMKAWVSLAQLGTTVIMSLLRGLLRMEHLGKNDNKLADRPEMVVGYELDWLAFELPKTTSTPTPEKESSAQRTQPGYYQQLLSLRRRLAELTGHVPRFDAPTEGSCEIWAHSYVNVRGKAKSVAAAICAAAEILIHKDQPRHDIFLSIPAFIIPNPSPGNSDIHLVLKAPDRSSVGGWTLDSSQIEAILGLAMWSLISAERVVQEQDSNFKTSLANNIHTWRIVSASYEEYFKLSIQRELNLWLGPNAVQCSHSTLRLDRNRSYSLYDYWSFPPFSMSSWQHVADRLPSPLGRNRRKCGWIPVSDTLRALPGETPTDFAGPEIHATDVKVNIGVSLVKSEGSLLDICAQELFTALVIGLKDGLQESGLRNDFEDTLGVTAEEDHVRLQIPVISTLAKAFEDAGLGTHPTSLLCIFPALKSHFLLGDPKVIFSALTKRGTAYRKTRDWSKAELLLNYLLSYIVDPTSSGADASLSDAEVVDHLAVRTFRAVGELYRWSLAKSPDNARVAFGKKGLDKMDEMRRRFSLETQQILQMMTTYRGVADDLDEPAKERDMELRLLDNMARLGSDKHPLVQAILDRDRRNVLFQLSFLKVGVFPLAELTWVKFHPLADALPLAARNDWEEVVSTLLEMGADPNGCDGERRTAVSYCKELGNEVCLEILVANGASNEDAT